MHKITWHGKKLIVTDIFLRGLSNSPVAQVETSLKNASPVTDAAAIQAIKLISTNLRQAVANYENIETHENMAYASLLAGMTFNNTGLGYAIN